MKLKSISLLMFLAIFTSHLGFAQGVSINGTVTSASDGEPLPGVSIIVKGTTNGTVTTGDGTYSLNNVPKEATLQFSFIGMKLSEFVVGSQSTIDVAMEVDAIGLEEVVAVGYGVQKKENLTGAISTVKLDKAQNRPISNSTQALAGMAAGVSISQRSGQPGKDGAVIRIRGTGTLGNNNPLVLIDGIRGSLSNVNPADIATITVLKDAASSAIYGSRAANGVILVTTKSGKEGSEFKVSYNGYAGVQKATHLPEYVSNSAVFMEAFNKAIFNENPNATPAYSQEQINTFRNSTNPYSHPNTDWTNIGYQNASIANHNVNVRGSGGNTSYSLSLGYMDQEGIVLGTDQKQYTARLNLDTKVSDKFDYSLKLALRHDDINEPVVGAGTAIGWITRGVPMQSPYTETGNYAFETMHFPRGDNFMAAANEGNNNTKWDNATFNLSGNYEIIDGLKYTGTVGVRKYHSLQKVFRPLILLHNQADESSTQPASFGGDPLSAWARHNTQTEITLISTLNYERTFAENHNIGALAGFSQETSKFNRLDASKKELPSNAVQEISAGSTDPAAGGYSVDFGLQSFFGRLTYNYMSRYLLEANIRYDGSSNFAEGNKWGIFPSFSAGWNISQESFLKDVDDIDNLKIRASWGQLGNQAINPNQYAAFYNLGQSYSYGGSLVGGAAQTNLPNPDVTWETSKQTDIGLDLSLWKGKLQLVTDYYVKLTEDILRPINISSTVGALSPPDVNLASVENKGWEFLLTHRNKIGDLSYSASANFTSNKNKVVDLPNPVIGGWSWLKEGRPIDEFYLIRHLGIFQTEEEVIAHGAQPNAKPGDVKFEDISGADGVPDGQINGDDRQPYGNSIPDFIYGINADVEYKGFNLSMIWQGVEGVYAITEEEQKPFFNSAGLPKYWLDHQWTPENPSNKYPRLVRGSNYVNDIWRNGTTFLMQDASFLRLKNVQFGYTFPKKITTKLKIDYLNVYVNATNPLTFTKYRELDPERNSFSGRGTYSNVQIYTLGLNITF